MNKRGLDWALSRATSRASFRQFSASLPHFVPLFFPPYYPGFLHCFFSSFLSCTTSGLKPLTFRIHLAYQSFFYTTTPLHHEVQLRFIPQKLIFILLDSLACPKINITIYCMLHAARCTKTCIAFVCPWRIKGGGDDLFLSPNRFHLSCPSSYKVPFSYINIMSSLIFCRKVCADRIMNYHAW